MGISDFLKGAADIMLDEYASKAKRMGKNDSASSARILQDFVNGKIDMNGNSIEDNEDEEW